MKVLFISKETVSLSVTTTGYYSPKDFGIPTCKGK